MLLPAYMYVHMYACVYRVRLRMCEYACVCVCAYACVRARVYVRGALIRGGGCDRLWYVAHANDKNRLCSRNWTSGKSRCHR